MRITKGSGLLAALLAGTVPAAFAQGTGNGQAQGVAQSMQEVEQQIQELQRTFNQSAAQYAQLATQANAIRHDVKAAFSGNANIGVSGGVSQYPALNVGKMLEYFPQDLIDDVNRRIYRAYIRGYYEWEQGQYPPINYVAYDQGYVFTRSIFDNWNQDVYFAWSWPQRPWELYVDSSGGRGGAVDIAREQQSLQPLHQAAANSLPRARNYRVQIEERRFLPDRWTNQSEWQGIESEVESKFKTYYDALAGFKARVDGQCRAIAEQVIRYNRGNGTGAPILELYLYSQLARGGTGTGTGNGYSTPGYGGIQYGTGTGTGDGYSNSGSWRFGSDLRAPQGLYRDTEAMFAWYFDQVMLQNLPDNYRREVERRLAQAYYRGAYDNKYGMNPYSFYGGGFTRYQSYGWSTRYSSGTGDGYSYGSSRRYNDRGTGTGTGSGTGSGRRSTSWSTGTGTGTGTSGTGTGSGYPGGSGTGTGGGYQGGSGTGTGGGYQGGSGTGTGGGYQNPGYSSGTGTGSSGYPSGGSGTGTGSGSSSGGTGTGTGGGSSRGSGTGTGSGN